MTPRFLLTAVAAVGVCSVLAGDDPKQDPDDKEGRASVLSAIQAPIRQLDGYQQWPMLTPGPVDVSERQFFSCAIVIVDREAGNSPQDNQGPHWSPAVRVYANPIAKAAIDGKLAKFPPGSILVKEKLLDRKIHAITAMIREPDGYDHSEAKNHWRFFYVDKYEELQFGRIESCRKCHQKAAKTDFAFLKYSNLTGYSSGP